MSELEFELTISAGEQPQTYGLHRVATEIGQEEHNSEKIKNLSCCYVLCIDCSNHIIIMLLN